MDDADKTERVMEIMSKANLSHSHRYVPTALAIGECLFCEAPLQPGKRWCDAECRDDWEKENAA